ncbi:hypothetical protein [Nocardia asiatica]|uniref:hypothetical protein n=1 Tax=Nocardia asiatica TaxID=209252 RepID=UPI002453D0BF|nr:hypothetical protein [Nocardia asiatica]
MIANRSFVLDAEPGGCAAMAPTTLPHIIDGLCDTDPTSREFIEHFADQLAVLARHIGLDAG